MSEGEAGAAEEDCEHENKGKNGPKCVFALVSEKEPVLSMEKGLVLGKDEQHDCDSAERLKRGGDSGGQGGKKNEGRCEGQRGYQPQRNFPLCPIADHAFDDSEKKVRASATREGSQRGINGRRRPWAKRQIRD